MASIEELLNRPLSGVRLKDTKKQAPARARYTNRIFSTLPIQWYNIPGVPDYHDPGYRRVDRLKQQFLDRVRGIEGNIDPVTGLEFISLGVSPEDKLKAGNPPFETPGNVIPRVIRHDIFRDNLSHKKRQKEDEKRKYLFIKALRGLGGAGSRASDRYLYDVFSPMLIKDDIYDDLDNFLTKTPRQFRSELDK